MVVSILKETCTSCGHYSWPEYNAELELWECAACQAPTLSDEELAELAEIIDEEEAELPEAIIYIFPGC